MCIVKGKVKIYILVSEEEFKEDDITILDTDLS